MSLDAESIRSLLDELAVELSHSSERATLVIVGGALLALHGLRRSTEDIDTIQAMNDRVRSAALQVALRNELDPAWLNARAVAFAPATFEIADCEVILDHPNLLVLGASADDVFLMKLNASRDRDLDDLIALWPQTTFYSAEEVVQRYCVAYPLDAYDAYLVDHVRRIEARATRDA